nr:hypothetical protein [Tanacetum cinerariifolium]
MRFVRESTLRFVLLDCVLILRFWFCDLLLRFGSVFCLLKTVIAFCLGKTLPVSKLGCVLSRRLLAFCLKTYCVLSPDSCVLSIFEDLSCVLVEGNAGKIVLHYGKENGVNILKSIDEGPYQMGTVREPIAEGTEGAPQLAKDIYTLINHYTDAKDIWDNVKMLLEGSELTKEDRESQLYDDFEHFRQHKEESIHDYYGRFVTAVKLSRGLRDSNYDQLYAYLKQHETHAKENKMMLERFSHHTVDPLALMSNVSNLQHYSPSFSTSSSTQVPQHLADNPYLDSSISPTENLIENLTNTLALLTQSYRTFLPQTNNQLRTSSNARNQARDLALNMDNMFQANDCDAFDSDVDEAPMAQTMFMSNLSSADPVTDEAGPSYDSDILYEVRDHDHDQDAVCAHHEEHTMHDSVQLNHVVDSHANYTSDSNMILYDQYVKDNEVAVVHSNVSSVPNDAFMMIYNDMCEPHAQSISNPSRNTVVENSLTDELATYKEQVELYKRRAKFELTE